MRRWTQTVVEALEAHPAKVAKARVVLVAEAQAVEAQAAGEREEAGASGGEGGGLVGGASGGGAGRGRRPGRFRQIPQFQAQPASWRLLLDGRQQRLKCHPFSH